MIARGVMGRWAMGAVVVCAATASAQKPPKRTLVTLTSSTSTPAKAALLAVKSFSIAA